MSETINKLWIIDSHAHYCHSSFSRSFQFLDSDREGYRVEEGTRETVLERLWQRHILASIEPGVSLASNLQILEQCQASQGRMFPAVGVHPTRTHQEKWADRGKLKALVRQPGVVALGETGLDYHYPRKEQHRLCQAAWFLYQLNLAHVARLPVILHVRQADEDALRILKHHPARKYGGVVHCFYRDWDIAQRYLDLGYHIGVGGTLLQSNERGQTLREAVRKIPLSRILVETDSPFILPDCKENLPSKVLRRTRNTSLILPRVIEKIAELKELPVSTVGEAVLENTVKLFSLQMNNDARHS